MDGIINAKRDYFRFVMQTIANNIGEMNSTYIEDLNGYWFRLIDESVMLRLFNHWNIDHNQVRDHINAYQGSSQTRPLTANRFMDFFMPNLEEHSDLAAELNDSGQPINTKENVIRLCDELSTAFGIDSRWDSKQNTIVFLNSEGKELSWSWQSLIQAVS